MDALTELFDFNKKTDFLIVFYDFNKKADFLIVFFDFNKRTDFLIGLQNNQKSKKNVKIVKRESHISKKKPIYSVLLTERL